MSADQPSGVQQNVGRLTALLDLQARSRRNALQATRLIRLRRAEQHEADDAVRSSDPSEALTPTPARETEPVPAPLRAAR